MVFPFSKSGKQAVAFRFSQGRTGYAVGDIHGRADLLERMLDKIESEFRVIDESPPVVVFLGDYIDRGPASRRVIELLLSWRPHGFERRFLKGNHEAAMLSFIDDPAAGKAWLGHGGLETLASYQVHPLPSQGSSEEDLRRARDTLQAQLPHDHQKFLNDLERYAVIGDYCFVHAGVDPAKPLEMQSDADLYWIRRRFLDDKRVLAKRIVHGHTPAVAPFADQRRIGLDTGAYFSGVLAGARFDGEEVALIQVRL